MLGHVRRELHTPFPCGDEAAGLEVEASDKEAAAKKWNAMAGVRDYIQELIKRSKNG